MFSARLSYAFTDPAAVALLQGLTEATEDKGYELLLLPGYRGEETEFVAVRDAVVGAFCLYCMPDEHPAVQAALDRRLPVIIVDEPRLPAPSTSGSTTAEARAWPRSTSRGSATSGPRS